MTREALYGFVAGEKTTYPVRLLCRLLQVSASAFYDWIRRGSPTVSHDDLGDAHAADMLREAWVEHCRVYGARRLTAAIRDRESGSGAWNRKRVARLMRVAGIEGVHRRQHGKIQAVVATTRSWRCQVGRQPGWMVTITGRPAMRSPDRPPI